jgi:hypothetical protein
MCHDTSYSLLKSPVSPPNSMESEDNNGWCRSFGGENCTFPENDPSILTHFFWVKTCVTLRHFDPSMTHSTLAGSFSQFPPRCVRRTCETRRFQPAQPAQGPERDIPSRGYALGPPNHRRINGEPSFALSFRARRHLITHYFLGLNRTAQSVMQVHTIKVLLDPSAPRTTAIGKRNKQNNLKANRQSSSEAEFLFS